MSPIAQPHKSDKRSKVVAYAALYCLHMIAMYMEGCKTGEANDLRKFLKWLDKRFWEAQKELQSRTNWDVKFKPDDIYKLEGMMAIVSRNEAIGGLEGIAKFIYAVVKLYMEEAKSSSLGENSLTDFSTKFLPKFSKNIQYGNKK